MKIIELNASNVKRLRAVDITPDKHVQVISGRNAQGKTSVLDSIWLALGGGSASRETIRPIRDGETKASVRLDLGDFIVTRTWTGDKTTLTVESAQGSKLRSPQAVLDALVGRLSFDPLEFTRLNGRDQVAALLDIIDLDVDLDALAVERKAAYDRRTEIGRDGKALDGQAAGLGPIETGLPSAEVSVSDLFEQHSAAARAHREYDGTLEQAKIQSDRVFGLSESLDAAVAVLAETQARIDAWGVLPDLDALRLRLETAEDTNAAVRRNLKRANVAAETATTRAAFTAETNTITRIDKSKADALAGASFPVEGLGFTDDGVTYNGVPFSQASASEQIRVSLAMAMSLNPQLRVIRILDGSLLDAENLELIGDMARDRDYQVWIEKVGSDGVGVVIEDGSVVTA